MTGPSAPDPAVETVTQALRGHDIRWSHAEQTYTCLTCGWTANVDQPLPEYHAGDVVVAALRAAAGTADVYELALMAYRTWYATGAWVAAVRAVLDRLAITGAENRVICTCYPSGFSPETYEGPQVDCDMHGQPSVAWEQGIQQGRREMREEAAFAATPVPVPADRCNVCGAIGGEHGTPAMAHDCDYPGCVFGPDHAVGYHFVDGVRVPATAAVPVPAADTDEALRQRLTRIFDLESAGDDPWRLDLMCAALSTHVTEAEERGRRAGLTEAARFLNTDPSAVLAILQDDARRDVAEHRSRLADETAPITSDDHRTDGS